MRKERDNKRHRRKPITQTVMAFLECLNLRRSSSSSDAVKAKSRNEKEEEASHVKTTARSLNVASKRTRKPMVSSGKRGGVNKYDM
ncbi:elicitor peptide 5 [Raphanus sativus]|uniref:Elicitor peptide 5 n=1 Tax=Raphanus sativus TaxID=3726 RepID=A0A6J0K555_RAPSA|nr:elicitor peptide 5 [Raphanus sativus]